jgi:hypothetical protein
VWGSAPGVGWHRAVETAKYFDGVTIMKLAHILNVTEINESKKASYLHIAQPLTMRSMVIARKTAQSVVDVDLVAVKHKAEQVSVPPEIRWAPDLETYAWEHIDALKDVVPRKPLPRLKDIVRSLYNASDAEYFVYTNLDIGLYPHFYLKVKDMIEKGYDAFCINRRTLPKEFEGMLLDESNVELVFVVEGTKHVGIDCFVFKREIVPSLDLGDVYVGYPPVGQVLKTQIEVNSRNFMWFKEERWTFHIGNDLPWASGGPYFEANETAARGRYVKCFKTNLYQKLRNRLSRLIRG